MKRTGPRFGADASQVGAKVHLGGGPAAPLMPGAVGGRGRMGV